MSQCYPSLTAIRIWVWEGEATGADANRHSPFPTSPWAPALGLVSTLSPSVQTWRRTGSCPCFLVPLSPWAGLVKLLGKGAADLLQGAYGLL